MSEGIAREQPAEKPEYPVPFHERQKIEPLEAEKRSLLEKYNNASAPGRNMIIGSEVFRILQHRYVSDWQSGSRTEYQSPILERQGVYDEKYGDYRVPFVADLNWSEVGHPRSGKFKFDLYANISNKPRPLPPAFGAHIPYALDYLKEGPIQWAQRRMRPQEQKVSYVQTKEISPEQQKDAIVFHGIGFALESLRQQKYTEIGVDMLEGLLAHFKDLTARNPDVVDGIKKELQEISERVRQIPDEPGEHPDKYHQKEADRINKIVEAFKSEEK